jgi:hypothetical protein
MPFSGGGGGALPAHVHNNVPLQGGPLDFANDTIAGLNVGSTTYSDGAALQELVIGAPSQILTVNGGATAPEWAAASGGGAWTPKESFTADGVSNPHTFTFASAFDFASYAALRVDLSISVSHTGNWDLDFRWNGATLGATLNAEMFEIDSGASAVWVVTNDSYFPIVKTVDKDSTVQVSLFFYYNPHDNTKNSGTMIATIPEERRSKSGSFWANSSYSTISDFVIKTGGAIMTTDATIQTYTLEYS